VTAYLARRLAQAVPVLLLVSLALFGLLHLIPGGPEQVAGGPHTSAQARLRLIHTLGLDQPLPVQYARWLWGTLHLDFGYTFRTGQPVTAAIADRLPATLELLGIAFALALLLAIPIGVIGALRQYSIADYVLTLLSYLGISLPIFWLAELLIIALAVQHTWLPTGGQETIGGPSSLWDRIHHLILPVIVLALVFTASWSRYLRSSMLQVLHQEYLRTARARGLARTRIILKHALRNAMIPLVTVVALDVGSIFGGAVVTEQIFAWPGLGTLFFDSLTARDYPVLMALLVLSAAGVIVCNIVADVVYALLDPRIRLT
jgi:peptide/nickel transport system permease protein